MDAAIANCKPFASLNIVWWHVLSLRVFREEGRYHIVWWHLLSLRVFRKEGRLNIYEYEYMKNHICELRINMSENCDPRCVLST